MDAPTNNQVKERPRPRVEASSRDQAGVVELPWPEEKDRQPEAERQESRGSPAGDARPKAEKPEQGGEQEKTKHPPPKNIWNWAGPLIGGILVIAAAALVWSALKPSEPKTSYTLVKASVATVTVAAHAQGRLAARNPVDVVAPAGARLERAAAKSGDHVRQGQILAILTSESARTDLVDASAEAAVSQSTVARADADVADARAAQMRARNSATAGAADAAQAGLARAIARANEARALLGAQQMRLAAVRAKLNGLVVRAPFDGIVLRSSLETTESVRAVARGQTLFTLVRDLSAFDLTADFPENAIGPLHAGQQAMFTVAAFPQRAFAAKLDAIGTWPKMVHKEGGDVTLYPATLSAANPDETLRPGMSADVAIILAQAKDALTVPNTALIFRPAADVEKKYPPAKGAYPAPVAQSAPPSGATPGLGTPSLPAKPWSPVTLSSAPRPGRVWVLEGDTPRPRDIMIGLSDGNFTQVISGELRAGDAVITSALVQARGSGGQS